MNKFTIKQDDFDPTLLALTFWSSPTNGVTFRLAVTDLQELSALINTYTGVQQ